MRHSVQYDRVRETWEVVDALGAEQTVGIHNDQAPAVFQAEAEEQRWRRFGPSGETFALVAF